VRSTTSSANAPWRWYESDNYADISTADTAAADIAGGGCRLGIPGRPPMRWAVPRHNWLMKHYGIEMIAPLTSTRTKTLTQDGRTLRRYRRRWKVERLFAWLHNYRRIVVRWERYPDNFLAMLHLASAIILLRHL
jgi:IS4 transposase